MKRPSLFLFTLIFALHGCSSVDNADKEAVLLPPNIERIDDIEVIRSQYSDYFQASTFLVNETIDEITVSGDYGFVIGNWEGALNPVDGSAAAHYNNKTLAIYKKQDDGSWHMYRIMYSSNEPPRETLSTGQAE